ncbi:MAG: hypothetical protein IH931_08470, partial [candidate division Zixibacteria bacterium]|nr:hypothetical protein [candidate division Zixibacteria bacterium]
MTGHPFGRNIVNPAADKPITPNPAFENLTHRDGYWGAKIVMSFTDEDIRAIVAEAQMTDKAAQEYLIKTMIERRDKVGRYWFHRMNPIDKFEFRKSRAEVVLAFHDLAVDGKLERREETKYIYALSHRDKGLHRQMFTDRP